MMMIDIMLFISIGAMMFYVKDLERRLFEQETYLHLVDKVVETTSKLLGHVIKDHYLDDDEDGPKEYLQ
jgi:hypothetical protein